MRTLLKIISLSLLVSISIFANVQKIDECKIDLYYANGIMIDMDVTQAKHELRWNDMVDDMFISNPEEYKKIANAKIAYNASQGFIDDVFESAEQVMSNEWGWEKFSIFFRAYLETHNIQEAYDTHILNLTAQVTAYKESIKLGHGVIVIAHSQGNYYTNEAYEKLDAWMKDYFHMFGVATPANHVAGFPVGDATAPYVLFHNDFINSIVTALPSNLDDTNPDHNSFPSIAAHDFYESYMKEETSKKLITDFIIDEIQKHSKNDSQWELDQELNKGTKDYKITLKHRFDTTITSMQDVEVYLFNASKKLYHVIDNTGGNGWVKASCGGEEIFDYWDGQENNESYLINNDEREKIILKTKQFSFILNYDLEYTLSPTTNSGIKYHRGISYTYIAPDTNCPPNSGGGGHNGYGFVDSGDDYFLNQVLSYERKEWERYYIQTTNRNVKCIINSHGYEVSQTEPMMLRGEETRTVVESSDTKKHYLLEQEYIIKIKN